MANALKSADLRAASPHKKGWGQGSVSLSETRISTKLSYFFPVLWSVFSEVKSTQNFSHRLCRFAFLQRCYPRFDLCEQMVRFLRTFSLLSFLSLPVWSVWKGPENPPQRRPTGTPEEDDTDRGRDQSLHWQMAQHRRASSSGQGWRVHRHIKEDGRSTTWTGQRRPLVG